MLEGISRFFTVLLGRIIIGTIGHYVRNGYRALFLSNQVKKRKNSIFSNVIDVEEWKDRMVGFATILAIVFVIVVIF